MRIWAISDLHLPGGSQRRRHRMEIHFGWGDYIGRMARTWDALVRPEDLVLIPGDISWASTARRVLQNTRGKW